MADTLRDELAQAILATVTDQTARTLVDEQAAADAVLVLVEQRIAEAHAEHAPDESPGDVIHAEPDGTIVLDDGITTWNPRRACEFLLREQERSIAAKIEAIEHRVAQPGHTYSGVARPPARDIEAYRSDVLRAVRRRQSAQPREVEGCP